MRLVSDSAPPNRLNAVRTPGGMSDCRLARRRLALEGLAQVRQRRHVPGTVWRRVDPARHCPRTALDTEQICPVNDEGGRTSESASLRCLVGVDDLDLEPDFREADVVQCRPEQRGGNLDPGTASVVVRALREHASSGATVIIVTHSPEVADSCDRTLQL